MKRCLIIINPSSGKHIIQNKLDRIIGQLTLQNIVEHFEIFYTEKKDDAYYKAKDCDENQYDFIMSVGGDGTLNEVISGAVYKSFSNEEEAKAFIKKEERKVSDDLGLLAYVDGSYNIKTKEYGYGCVLIEGQQVIKQLLGKGNQPDYASMRNVSGEILGCMKAIAYAIDHHYESICIYYDYEGIEKWATGLWKANKEQTQNYVKTIKK